MSMKELEILLERRWIIREEDKELYYRMKDSLSAYKSFLTDKLGYHIMINPYLIKLEKIPGQAESWMGIEEFEDRMEYMFLCLLLMFLEDRDMGEQFVLSQVTDFIQGTCPGKEPVDWTLYRHRRYLIKVLRFAQEAGMMKNNDGNEQNFALAREAEVLYENTGVSRYFVRNFTGNIMHYHSYQDIEKDEWLDIDGEKGLIRRHRVYRRLIMSPAVYHEGADDADYLYLKNYRNVIQNDLEKYLDSSLHVHKNGAFLVLPPDKDFRDTFPEKRALCDIVLQMNTLIREKMGEGILTLRENDTILISRAYFETMLEEVGRKNRAGWSKEYREMKFENLVDDVMRYMEDFGMIQLNRQGAELTIMSLAGKLVGSYPADFTGLQEEVGQDA